MEQFYDKVSASAAYIRAHIPQTPTVGIILGSGLGGLVDAMTDKTVIPYGDIPHFPCSTVAGHAGNLVIGRLGSQVAAALQGRFHYYEGFSMKEVTYPVYVLALLGVKTLIVTNACGGINRTFVPGDLMLLSDHINMLGTNSLIGPNDERFGPRFPDMTEAYPHRLREKAHQAAGALGFAGLCLLHDQYALMLPMVGIGIAWAGILAMPYAILSPRGRATPHGRIHGYLQFHDHRPPDRHRTDRRCHRQVLLRLRCGRHAGARRGIHAAGRRVGLPGQRTQGPMTYNP